MAVKRKRVTRKDVKKRMVKMNVTGWSSMAKYGPSEITAYLDEIQRIIDRRINASIDTERHSKKLKRKKARKTRR